jgi:hypothetical protein
VAASVEDIQNAAIAPLKDNRAATALAEQKPLLNASALARPPNIVKAATHAVIPNAPPSCRIMMRIPDAIPI